MSSDTQSEWCWVCGQELVGRKEVKGSSRLKHSARLLYQALKDLTKQEVEISAKLCFRCYRLVLGMDHHSHQLLKQQTTFFTIYHQARYSHTTTHTTDREESVKSQYAICKLENEDNGVNHTMGIKHFDMSSDQSQITTLSTHPNSLHKVIEPGREITPYIDGNSILQYNSISSLYGADTDHAIDMSRLSSLSVGCKYKKPGEKSIGEKNESDRDYNPQDIDYKSKSEVEDTSDIIEAKSSGKISSASVKETVVELNVKYEVRDDSLPGAIMCEVTEDIDGGEESHVIVKVAHDKATENPPNFTVSDTFVAPCKRRKKKSMKWKDYDYYEEDGKSIINECNKTAAIIQQHMKFILPRRKKIIYCDSCNQNFSTKMDFGKHSCDGHRRAGRRGKITYTCKGCQATFPIRRDYIRHIDTCYKNIPVICTICQVRLPSAAYLPRHLNSLHKGAALIKKSSLCDQCGRKFSRKESLERHQATAHGVTCGAYQCSQCGRTFPHTAILAEHLRAHRGYPCVECGNKRIFSCRSNLLLHRRTHHPTTHPPSAHHPTSHPYHCQPCNKRWKFHASYTYHVRKYHSGDGEDLHRCGGCKVPFTSQKALLRHTRFCLTSAPLHTDPTPPTSTPAPSLVTGGNEGEGRSSRCVKSKGGVSPRKAASVVLAPIQPKTGTRTTTKPRDTQGSEIRTSPGRGEGESEAWEVEETRQGPKEVLEVAPQLPLVPASLPLPSICPVLSVSTPAPLASTSFPSVPLVSTPLVPASEIVLEAIEELSGDCQFVVLVEDCLAVATQDE